MHRFRLVVLAIALAHACAAFASVFGSVRGVIHDPQHRPVDNAMVMIKSTSSDWSATTNSDANGTFTFSVVSIGEYTVSVAAIGFEQTQQNVVVNSGTQPVVHFALKVGGTSESITVSAAPEAAPTDSATPTTLVSRLDVAETPGADRSNSLAMITDYVPGAYFTHDQLHVRGGHQTSWLIDGVPVPNTNIASNVGPQLDPKDIDYLEVSRGSYGAEFGDRTYGVFNVMPRTGFERNREAELVLSAGNLYQTNDQFSFGNHTERFAYYTSVNGNRSDLGLQPPVPQVVHDAENGYGGFGSLIFNVDPSDQLRFVTSLHRDFYQIPYDPFPGDIENAPIAANGFQAQYPTVGLRDTQHEADALANFSWVHTFNSKLLLTVSPFYHFNRANYDGLPTDIPDASTDHRSSQYAGGQLSFSATLAKNTLQAGDYGFYQRNDEFFGLTQSGAPLLNDREQPVGSVSAFFLDDKFTPFSWLTLSAGMRPTHFSGVEVENSVSPRFGAALTVPHLNWTLRAFYGHYYQAPPLVTISGPLQQFCVTADCGFAPLAGERDEEHQFGITIPFRGWIVDADTFVTHAHNFFDHNCIGSGTCFPVTIDRTHISGWEVTLRSPRIAHRGQLHLSYSNQVAQAGGAINGGLTNFVTSVCSGPPTTFCPLDHDQRNTLNLGGDVTLPWRAYASTNIYYGSGFSNAFPGEPYPGGHLVPHTTFDLSLGKDFYERFSASVNLLNVANRRVELDNSQTFGGFHWNNPREVYAELRYRFHF
jgi:TonB dependent receptor/Carboxypeptidase regulatory-like domain/TonB-dependent Receptor Plug Domain